MIKLYQYFFDKDNVDSVTPAKEIGGESRRSLNGRLHTIMIGSNNKYETFQVELSGLDLNKLKIIYTIIDLIYDTDIESVEFITPEGEEYQVTIPLPLEDSFNVEGEKDNYSVSLTLEEIEGGA